MNKRVRTLLQLLVGVLISAALLWLTYRKRDFGDLVNDMAAADTTMVVLSGMVLLVVFWLRAMRWRLMILSAGYPVRSYPTLLAVTIGYIVNAVTPKIGEIVRCTALYRSDKVPVATSIGTVFTERVIDALVLFGGIFLIFLMEVERLGDLFANIFESLFGAWTTTQMIMLAGGLVLIGVVGILGLIWLRKRASSESENPGLVSKVNEFISGMLIAVKSIFKLQKPGMFILLTVLIWVALILMNVLFLKALPMTAHLSWYFAVLVLFIGGIGWAMPVPAGMGTTHYIVTLLFVAFQQPAEMGENVGLLSNGATFLFTIIWGLIAWGLYMLFLVRDKKAGEVVSDDS